MLLSSELVFCELRLTGFNLPWEGGHTPRVLGFPAGLAFGLQGRR